MSRLPLHQRQERGVDGVSLLKLVGVLTQEEVTGLDKLGQDESENFSEVETGDHLFKGLLAGLVGRLVDDDVVLGSGWPAMSKSAKDCGIVAEPMDLAPATHASVGGQRSRKHPIHTVIEPSKGLSEPPHH